MSKMAQRADRCESFLRRRRQPGISTIGVSIAVSFPAAQPEFDFRNQSNRTGFECDPRYWNGLLTIEFSRHRDRGKTSEIAAVELPADYCAPH